MKKFYRYALPTLLALNITMPAQAYLFTKFWETADATYFGYHLGALDQSRMKTKRLYNNNSAEYIEKDTYDSPSLQGAFNLGAEKGRKRFEVELLGFRTTLKNIKVKNAPVPPFTSPTGSVDSTSGRLTAITMFFNFFLSTPQYSDHYPLNAYAGLGIGPSFIQARTSVAGLGSEAKVGNDQVNKSSVELAGQFIAGLAFQVDEATSVFFDYRYITTTPLDFVGAVGVTRDSTVNSLPFNGFASAKLTAQAIQLGVTHYFS